MSDDAFGVNSTGKRLNGTLLPWIEGLVHTSYGHSFQVVQSTPNVSPNGTTAKRLSLRHFASSYSNNNSNAYRAVDTALKVNQTWTIGTSRGFVLLDTVVNDVGFNHNSAIGLKCFEKSLEHILWSLRAGTTVPESSYTYTLGSWTVNSSTNFVGGANRYSTTNTAQFTAPYTGSRAALVLYGQVSAATATCSITVDGITIDNNFDPNNTIVDGQLATGYGPIVVPLIGLSGGAHVATVTKLDTGTTAPLFADNILIESAAPPLIAVIHATRMTTAGYQRYSAPYANDDDITTFNQKVDEVIRRFPNDRTILTIKPNSQGWDPNTMTCSDGQHPNDRGAAFIADCVEREIQRVGFRPGLNR